MADYVLHVSSYIGIMPWAGHYTGRVSGEAAEVCCGRTLHYNAPEVRGRFSCDAGHVLPDRVEWDVEADMTEGDYDRWYDRWAAKGYEGDGPNQFRSPLDVTAAAIHVFLDGQNTDGESYWHQSIAPAKQGDRLLNDYGEVIAVKDEVKDDAG